MLRYTIQLILLLHCNALVCKQLSMQGFSLLLTIILNPDQDLYTRLIVHKNVWCSTSYGKLFTWVLASLVILYYSSACFDNFLFIAFNIIIAATVPLMHLCLISNYLFLVHFTVILYKMQLLNSIYNSQLQHLKYGVKLMCSNLWISISVWLGHFGGLQLRI